MDIRHCNANDIFEIERVVDMAEEKFNPPQARNITIVGMVGDQPVYKALFRILMEAYVKKLRRALWLVQIPGGFHIDKQGLIPTMKTYLAGCGLGEMLPFSGLSPKHQDNFHALAHYRKNRRFFSQMTCALLLRLHKVIVEMDSDFSAEMDNLVGEVVEFSKLSDGERARILSSNAWQDEVRGCLPPGSRLAVENSIHPSVLRIGKLLSDRVHKLSIDSQNMKLFGEIQLMNVLIPWTGYNHLIRKGQTWLVDKFYACFVGLLHGTNKLNYQENLLFYKVERDCISQAASDVLYEKGHLVSNPCEKSTDTNLSLDEQMESGIIRDTKMWHTNNPTVLESSPAFTMLVAKSSNAASRELTAGFQKQIINDDTNVANMEHRLKPRSRDREKRTALNVMAMV